MARFSVDTHLFRELGALLVGRDSTALVELIKNSYDADATRVIVFGEGISTDGGSITVADDGLGMTPEDFESGFLRIAGRSKESGDRRSPLYRRRYTGAKGVGRLSAHKLARAIEVISLPAQAGDGSPRPGVDAIIDWEAVERHASIDDVGDAVVVKELPAAGAARNGTTLRLLRLRRRWSKNELGRFVGEVQTFEAPEPLRTSLPETVLTEPLLFSTPRVRNTGNADPGFAVDLAGDFAAGANYWRLLAERAAWIIEIDADRQTGNVQYVVAPTSPYARSRPDAEVLRLTAKHPDPLNGPFFQARVFVRERRLGPNDPIASLARTSNGIRVYMEGFRVLPYGERGDDWLRLDADYTRRREPLEFAGLFPEANDEESEEGLLRFSNLNYYGAVFLTEEGSPTLQMLVNREGFLPDAGFETLRDLVRTGVDLSVRHRASLSRRKPKPSGPSQGGEEEPQTAVEDASTTRLRQGIMEATRELAAIRVSIAAGQGVDIAVVDSATSLLDKAASNLRSLQDEQALLRLLASLGTQFAAFVHEVDALLAQGQTVRDLLDSVRDTPDWTTSQEALLEELQVEVDALVETLERQSSFLTEIGSADARTVRRPLDPRERFESAERLLLNAILRKELRLETDFPEGLRTPPMLPSELTIVWVNLLTNAIKFSERGGRIAARGSAPARGRVELLLENTGTAVDVRASEKLFRPFVSTTTDVDELLGKGMGLGLSITRRLITDNGGTIEFVDPTPGFSTAVRFTLPPVGRG